MAQICAWASLLLGPTMAVAASVIGDPPANRIPVPLAPNAASYDLGRDARGLLYVATEEAVLVYDGVRWERVATPGSIVARALERGPAGQMYVGGFNRLGVIRRDAFGALNYSDWTERLPAEYRQDFEDVWDVRADAHAVYFRTLKQLFRFGHDGRLTGTWATSARFGVLEFVDGELWLQWRGEGLKRLNGEAFEMVPGGAAFADTLIYHLWAHPRGGQVVVSQRPQLEWLYQGRVQAIGWLPAEVPPTALSAHATLSGGIAVSGVQDGRLVELDFLAERAKVSSVSNDYISGMVVGAHGELWTVDDEVLTRVELSSPWRLLDAADGVRGTQAELREFAGDWYALSSAGVYRAQAVDKGNPHFAHVDIPITEAWSIAAHGQDLLIAESYALWRLRPGAPARAISDKKLYPRTLLAAKDNSQRFYIGTGEGFAVADFAAADEPHIQQAELGPTIDSLVEVAPGRLLAGSQTAGLFEITVAADGSFKSAAAGSELGLEPASDPEVRVFELGGAIHAATAQALYRWDGRAFVVDELGGLRALLPPATVPTVVQSGDGSRWALSDGRAFLHEDGRWRELIAPTADGPALRSLHLVDGQQAVYGSTSRLLIYDRSLRAPPPVLPAVEFRHAWLEGSGQRRPLPLRGDRLGELPPRATLRLQFAAPALAGEAGVLFRQRVIGIDRHWSDWSPVAEASLGALPGGQMRLQVQARKGSTEPGPPRSLSWEITPLWHERADVRVLLISSLLLLGGLGAGAAARWRLKRLRARNERLEEIVHARTEALEQANVQLRAQTLRDGLTGIANRRAFDNALSDAWHRATIERSPLTLLMIDADHFKAFNDHHGHLQGDELLRALAAEIAREDHGERLTARWGGEEFAVLMPHTDAAAACKEAERVRSRVMQCALGVSVSVGVATLVPAAGMSVESLLAAADGALYAAKAAGRNRVIASVEIGEPEVRHDSPS